MTNSSIIVGRYRREPGHNTWLSESCWQTFPHEAGDEANMRLKKYLWFIGSMVCHVLKNILLTINDAAQRFGGRKQGNLFYPQV